MKDKEKQIEICENCKIKENCSHRILVNMEKCKVNDCDYFQNISTDKEKQIEEMAKDLYGEIDYDVNYYSDDNYSEVNFDYRETAKNIVEKGWVKLPEDSIVLSKEEQEIRANELIETLKAVKNQASKETAEKILNNLSNYIDYETFHTGHELKKVKRKVKELAKQFGVEVDK